MPLLFLSHLISTYTGIDLSHERVLYYGAPFVILSAKKFLCTIFSGIWNLPRFFLPNSLFLLSVCKRSQTASGYISIAL